MPEQKDLIATLWYRYYTEDSSGNLKNAFNNIDVLTSPFTENTHSILSMTEGPDKGFQSKGNSHIISYTSTRIIPDNPNSTVTIPMFKEILHIEQPNGSITAKSVYPDSDSGAATTTSNTNWTVLGGTGDFRKVNFGTIKYDNEGEIFGYKFSRKMEFYHVYDTEDNIPTVPTTRCCEEFDNLNKEVKSLITQYKSNVKRNLKK